MKIWILTGLLLLPRYVAAASPELIGPFGGSAAVVQVDPRRPGTVVAATSNALLFQSADGGDSWARLPFPPELRGTLHSFVVAPGTGVYLAGLASEDPESSGIYLSADGGQTWTVLKALGQREVWSIAVWSADPRVIAAGTADGVFLTRDGGQHWGRISPESKAALTPVVSLDFDPTDSRIVYAGTPHLPWKTTDGGVTWQPASKGMHDDSDVFSIHVDTSRPARVFASACSGLYRSLDKGRSWTKLPGSRDASYRTYQIAQYPTQPNLLFAGTTHGLIRSIDGGATWRKLSPFATRSIAFDPARAGRIYVATDDAGLFRSDDFGDSLRPINEGFCNRHVLSLASLGATLYASSPGGFAGAGIFRDVNPGGKWEAIDSVSPWRGEQILKVVPLDTRHLYVLTSKSVLLSRDAGLSWTSVGPRGASRLTTLLAPEADRGKLLVGTDTAIYYTQNGGQIWRLARTTQGHGAIRSLVAIGSGTIAALAGSSVLVSSDGIEYHLVPSPETDSDVHALVATGRDDLLAATSHGLMRSEDLGATWEAVEGVLGASTVSAICRHPTRPGIVFAARYGAIFISGDNGRTWEPMTSDGEDLPAIRELVVASGIPGSLFAITPAQGVYEVRLNSTVGYTACRNGNCGVVQIQLP